MWEFAAPRWLEELSLVDALSAEVSLAVEVREKPGDPAVSDNSACRTREERMCVFINY